MNWKSEIINIVPFKDDRGSLKKIIMQSQLESGNIEEVYLLYTGRGSVRGNHYHERTLEFFTIISGRAVIMIKDLTSGAWKKLIVSADDNKVIKVPPKVAHAFKNESGQPLIILAVSTREYHSDDPDTIGFSLLK